MQDIAIGRKEILKVLKVDRWRTIQKWKSENDGFAMLLRKHPISRKPFIVVSEVKEWLIRCDELTKSKELHQKR